MGRNDKVDRNAPITREFTVNLKKRLHGRSFKSRAPRAVKELKAFAKIHMGTDDNRVTVDLNQFVWSKGIRNVPNRVRVRLERRVNDNDEDGENSLYTLISHVPVPRGQYKGLCSVTVEEE
eukprot:TRINITY_DN11123_c0_g1_i1.p1 TRINITY_DN11123_c0_g1~~TRINITY_DN11123_c0_g1_i1.p1  ORF type:complete len:121 (-),score=21.96 TRINITY_DN11123_c0_g1_i1:76-438(-)